MRTSLLRAAGWALVALSTLAWWSTEGCAPAETDAGDGAEQRSLAGRLLGPLAGLAADIQWVRAHDALRRGRADLGLARADTALALAPEATGGWLLLARHLAFDRASEEREPDPARRLAWVRAALELARRGEASAREPAELAVWQGLVRVKEADEGDLSWPGGERALLEQAVLDFERAGALGHPDGAALAEGTRRRLEALPHGPRAPARAPGAPPPDRARDG